MLFPPLDFHFMCAGRSSHIVHYSISHVVMLFPPQYFQLMCAGILKHRSLIHQSSGDAVPAAVFHFLLCLYSSHMIHLDLSDRVVVPYQLFYFILFFSYVQALMPHTLLLIF